MPATRHQSRTIAVYCWAPGTPHPTADVRRILRTVLPIYRVPADAVEDAALAASELVANATEHAHGPYAMHLRRSGPNLIVEVHDGDPTLPRIPLPTSTTSPAACLRGTGATGILSAITERGRGLQLVSALTRGFTSARCAAGGSGKYVRFIINIQ
jgi:hypothetical protein